MTSLLPVSTAASRRETETTKQTNKKKRHGSIHAWHATAVWRYDITLTGHFIRNPCTPEEFEGTVSTKTGPRDIFPNFNCPGSASDSCSWLTKWEHQGSTHCVFWFWDAFLLIILVKNGDFSYCILHVSLNQSSLSPQTSLNHCRCAARWMFDFFFQNSL